MIFVTGFVLYYIVGYFWPMPMLSDELIAQLPPDPLSDPFSLGSILNQFNWVLSIGGVVTFVLGMLARKS